MTMTGHVPWSLLGKHPSRADFLRVNLSSEAAVEFHRFLELGVELLHRQRQPLALEPTRFLFAPKAEETVLWGVLRPSVDSAGRRFPLAAFLELEPDELPSSIAEVPFFGLEALDAVQAFLAERAESTAPLDADLEKVPAPGPDAIAAARAKADEALAAVKVEDLQALFFEGPAIGGAWYAVKSVLSACDTRRKSPGEAPTLECALSATFGAGAWLSIVAKGTPGAPPPSMVWNASRLYVALGALPPAVFLGLVGGKVSSNKVWPTSTSQQSAVDSARASLRSAPLLASPEATLLDALRGVGARR
jgi:type VI secretion system ImpM family protein